ncbi:MAG: ATP-dependent Clp protease ATP-binding subunit [Myxococcales bacterium]|nr:ATP-dependent Clp protease ATP-binding subunit [Myxococcales bacterium]
MLLQITLLVRELHGGAVLIRALADRSIVVFGLDEEAAILDLELLLEDQLARTHPRLLHRLASPDNAEVVAWWLRDALTVRQPEGRDTELSLKVSASVARHKEHHRVYFPTWNVRAWVPLTSEPEAGALAVLAEHAKDLSPGALLDRRIQRDERLRVLELSFEPAPLAAFTGKYLGLDRLPEGLPPEERARVERERRPPTPTLDAIADDLTRRASERELPRAAGLDDVVNMLQATLTGADRPAVVLLGAPGVGKTSVVHELAHRLAADRATDARRLWFADATRLIAMRGTFSDWRGQTLDVAEEIATTDAIWYGGAILPWLDAGKSVSSQENVAQLLRPLLARRRVRLVVEATTAEWSRVERRDPGLARCFTPVRIEEPDPKRSEAILRGLASLATARTDLVVEPSARAAARELAARYGMGESTHAEAVALLRRAIADRLAEPSPGATPLDRVALVDTFCRESGMPPALVRDDTPLDLDAVRAFFEARIVGQPAAVSRMVDLVGLVKAGLTDPTRPLGSFLFVGPTGVGKTQTAKTLAAYLFGASDRLIRFDMAEVVTADAVQRFVGRHGRPGKLVSEVRRVPFAVVLLDEIEKAHPAIFDVLLQVLGEARLSDEAGRTASFRNAVVIMTSNLGAETRRAAVGFGDDEPATWNEHYVGEAKRFFRPELFNRIDHVVAFDALPGAAIRDIAERELAAVAERQGLRQRGLELEVPEDVARWIAARGTDPRFGARPLKRSVEANLVGPLARHLSDLRKVPVGKVKMRLEDDHLVPRVEVAAARGHAQLDALTSAVLAVGQLRLLLAGCARSSAVRALRIEVGRVERLFGNARFARGFGDLAKAMAGHGDERALLEDFDGLMAHVESLEELGYEARFRRETVATADLEREREAVLARLRDVGLRLAGRGRSEAGRATLWLSWTGSSAMLSDLLEIYVSLAAAHGWGVELFRPVEARPLAGDDTPRTRFERIGAIGRDEHPKRLLHRGAPEGGRLVLDLYGPHAGTLLSGEPGTHRLHAASGETSEVRVGDAPFAILRGSIETAELERLAKGIPKTLLRLVNENRRIVEDRSLRAHFAIEPRVWRLYERFMLMRVYDRVFFEGAHRALGRA